MQISLKFTFQEYHELIRPHIDYLICDSPHVEKYFFVKNNKYASFFLNYNYK